MDATYAVPKFSGRRKTDDYYSKVTGIIRILRDKAPLSIIAAHLNSQGMTTPTGPNSSSCEISASFATSPMRSGAR